MKYILALFLNSSLGKHFSLSGSADPVWPIKCIDLGVDCLYSNDNDNDNKSSIMGIDGQAL